MNIQTPTKLFKSFICLFGLSASLVYAEVTLTDAANYSELQQKIEAIKDPAHTLLVLDDDNTLTTLPCPDPKNLQSCQYIGGTAWGIWQGGLPKTSPLRLSPEDSKIYQINNIIFSFSRSVYTEQDVPEVLEKLAHEGVTIIVETARDGSMMNATEAQLSALKVPDGTSLLNFMNRHGLKSTQYGANLTGSYYPCDQLNRRKVRYENGVYYLAGQNKGVMLDCLFQDLKLSEINPPVTHIVFMDDTPSNATDVYQFFKNSPKYQDGYQVVSINYHGMDAHRDAFLKGPMALRYQQQATRVWRQLNQAIQAAAMPIYQGN
jgi:hypothetical protein